MSAPRTERTRYAWRYSCSQERPTCNTSHAAARVMVMVRARGDPGRGAHSAAAPPHLGSTEEGVAACTVQRRACRCTL